MQCAVCSVQCAVCSDLALKSLLFQLDPGADLLHDLARECVRAVTELAGQEVRRQGGGAIKESRSWHIKEVGQQISPGGGTIRSTEGGTIRSPGGGTIRSTGGGTIRSTGGGILRRWCN